MQIGLFWRGTIFRYFIVVIQSSDISRFSDLLAFCLQPPPTCQMFTKNAQDTLTVLFFALDGR